MSIIKYVIVEDLISCQIMNQSFTIVKLFRQSINKK